MAVTRWTELGDFLRARRAELRPDEFGLPGGSRRRVPGLRRSEVAGLATISTEYYTRLEQGRLPASAPVLTDLARAMRLTADHRAYLFELAGKVEQDVVPPAAQQVQAPLRRMLDDLATTPAFVMGRLTRVLAWNGPAAALIADFGAVEEPERLFVRLLFSDPALEALYTDWPAVVRLAVAQLRMDSARSPDDPELVELVRDLSVSDSRFADFWTEHDAASRGTGTKRLRHPVVGDLTLDWQALAAANDPSQQIIIWTAEPGSPSEARLRRLVPPPPA